MHSKPIVVWNTAPVPEFLTNTRLSTETLILRLCRFADLARKAEVYTVVNLFLVSLQYQALRNVNQPNLQTPNMVIHTRDENKSNYEYQIYAGHLNPNPWSPPDSDGTYIYIIFSIWDVNLFLYCTCTCTCTCTTARHNDHDSNGLHVFKQYKVRQNNAAFSWETVRIAFKIVLWDSCFAP